MLWFFNLERASAISCDNYDDLFQYIHEIEKLKTSIAHFQPLQSPMCLDSLSHNESEFKKQWCLDYCKNHNYIVVETIAPANNLSKTSRAFQKHSNQLSFAREAF